jgi:hypothetical protein
MPWSPYDRRPLFAGTNWAGGSSGVGSAGGPPPIPPELRSLIRRMAAENPLWGEERIANELLANLGTRPQNPKQWQPRPLLAVTPAKCG